MYYLFNLTVVLNIFSIKRKQTKYKFILIGLTKKKKNEIDCWQGREKDVEQQKLILLIDYKLQQHWKIICYYLSRRHIYPLTKQSNFLVFVSMKLRHVHQKTLIKLFINLFLRAKIWKHINVKRNHTNYTIFI